MINVLKLRTGILQPMRKYYQDMSESHGTSGDLDTAQYFQELSDKVGYLDNDLCAIRNVPLDTFMTQVSYSRQLGIDLGFDYDLLVQVMTDYLNQIMACIDRLNEKRRVAQWFINTANEINDIVSQSVNSTDPDALGDLPFLG